jgi:hypothetical protein
MVLGRNGKVRGIMVEKEWLEQGRGRIIRKV